MAETQDPPIGQSSLFVPIPQALPKPPDVPEEGRVPGGALVPVTPVGVPQPPLINRNQVRVQFPEGQGIALLLRRIRVALPVFVGEIALEQTEYTLTEKWLFPTEVARNEWVQDLGGEGKEGRQIFEEKVQSIGANAPYERTTAVHNRFNTPGQPLEGTQESTTVVTRSIVPITVTVVIRLIGPEGNEWTESFDVPCRYYEGAPGKVTGTGQVEAYADLQNGIAIDPSKPFSIALFVFVPTATANVTNTQPGVEMKGTEPVAGVGGITLFYDVEPVAVGK